MHTIPTCILPARAVMADRADRQCTLYVMATVADRRARCPGLSVQCDYPDATFLPLPCGDTRPRPTTGAMDAAQTKADRSSFS